MSDLKEYWKKRIELHKRRVRIMIASSLVFYGTGITLVILSMITVLDSFMSIPFFSLAFLYLILAVLSKKNIQDIEKDVS